MFKVVREIEGGIEARPVIVDFLCDADALSETYMLRSMYRIVEVDNV